MRVQTTAHVRLQRALNGFLPPLLKLIRDDILVFHVIVRRATMGYVMVCGVIILGVRGGLNEAARTFNLDSNAMIECDL